MQQYEQNFLNQVWTALEPDIASETAVLLSRPPQPLLEHPPKRTTFYMLLSRRKLSACVQTLSVAFFVVGFLKPPKR